MADYYTELFSRYRSKGVLIDTNLLLVYFIGKYDPSRIAKFKRTQTFTSEDFRLLESAFSFFGKIVTLPNILTEVSNLSNQLPENIKPDYYGQIGRIIANLEEHYLTSDKICSLAHFKQFGLTDSAIISLVKDKYLVLTDDFRLANYLESIGIDVINFNHIRTLNWGL